MNSQHARSGSAQDTSEQPTPDLVCDPLAEGTVQQRVTQPGSSNLAQDTLIHEDRQRLAGLLLAFAALQLLGLCVLALTSDDRLAARICTTSLSIGGLVNIATFVAIKQTSSKTSDGAKTMITIAMMIGNITTQSLCYYFGVFSMAQISTWMQAYSIGLGRHSQWAGYLVLALMAASLLLLVTFNLIDDPGTLSPLSLPTWYKLTVSLLLQFVIFVGWHLGKTTREAMEKAVQQIDHANETSERLLLNILPAPIAARLKTEPIPLADGYSQATILFADIVGFTPLSASMKPRELVLLLNGIFSEFDSEAERLGLEKIKTIGDAYMVAAGFPASRADHATAIAEMALAMRNIISRYHGPDGSHLRIRAGIHSGPVIAGVIGHNKFIYDAWGDTVNTASRMESHGLPDEIQVSETSKLLLDKDFVLHPRGQIEVKGIGPMTTWWLTGFARDAQDTGVTKTAR